MIRNQGLSEDDVNFYGTEYAFFCKKVTDLSGIKLHNYKSQQMHRRLVNYMKRNQIPDFLTFAKRLEKNQHELAKLLDYLTINVSEFFRNSEHWEVLRDEIIPELVRSTPLGTTIHAWSAGSSGGQEAYSLGMVFLEAGFRKVSILGTDIDEGSLKKAEEGLYSEDEIKGVPEALLSKYFDVDGQSYRINKKLRQIVRFEKQNLLGMEYPRNMDLVLCRNVLIYFTDEGKNHVLAHIARSIVPGGILFIGATEALFNARDYGFSQIRPFFYRRCS
ncbi:MAG: protein-glutamate O-methyltransferase CheR [Firmicutes bacterium]|nr:protein-glutamate O-methyltransferase CheR [Candidatus Fermentithermobacillaceae bacterium]